MQFVSPVDHYLAPPDIHQSQRIGKPSVLAFIVAILALVVEGYTVYALVQEHISLVTALFIHLVCCGALMLCYALFTPLASNRVFMALLLITTIPLGPVGAAGVLLAMLLWLWYSLFSTPFMEWFRTIFPSPVISRPEAIDEDLRTGRDEAAKPYEVDSFMDVLRYGNDDQKRRALSKITTFFTPRFAPALRFALQNESNMIRVQAATAISMVENRFLKRLMMMEKVYKQHRKQDVGTVLALANFLDDYAFSGILDEARERNCRVQAKDLYQEYLAQVPKDGVTRTRYGRLLLRLNELDHAIEQFEQAFEERPSATRVAWVAETYFRMGDFARLRELAITMRQEHPDVLGQMDAELRASLESWLSGAEARYVNTEAGAAG